MTSQPCPRCQCLENGLRDISGRQSVAADFLKIVALRDHIPQSCYARVWPGAGICLELEVSSKLRGYPNAVN